MFSFCIFIHYSNIHTHESHVGTLKVRVGIEQAMSGSETSATSATGARGVKILTTGIPDFEVLNSEDPAAVRVVCEVCMLLVRIWSDH